MNKKMFFGGLIIIIIIVGLFCVTCFERQQKKEKFVVTWSIYAGWMPWSYAYDNGIIKKWADKYDIDIEFKQSDYVPSIEAYVSGSADGVVMTNIEAVNMVASAGVDSTAVIIGDYSNGNDAVLARDANSLCDLYDKDVYLAKYSVSHYLVSRGFEILCHKDARQVSLINASDSDLVSIFLTSKDIKSVATWNPLVLDIKSQDSSVKDVFNSSQIPYEILDILFLKTDIAQKHPELASALTGAWYETLGIMSENSERGESALKYMAEKAGTNTDLFKKQLETTYLWKDQQAAIDFLNSENVKSVTEKVINFSYNYGLLEQNGQSGASFGVKFPDGSIWGNQNNVMIRFTNNLYKD